MRIGIYIDKLHTTHKCIRKQINNRGILKFKIMFSFNSLLYH